MAKRGKMYRAVAKNIDRDKRYDLDEALQLAKDGVKTKFDQSVDVAVKLRTACEETGLPPEVFVPITDTSAAVDCGQTTASRATVLGAAAIQRAARKLKADLDAGRSLSELIGCEYLGDYACNYTTKPDADVPEPKTHLTYGFATQVVTLNNDGSLKKVIAAHDVGKVMNPKLLEGQMEGSIHMGLGYALTEDFVVEGGVIQNRTIKSLNVLRAHHMPEIECIFVEEPDPETAYGARGVGEIGLVPTAPAVAATQTRMPCRRRHLCRVDVFVLCTCKLLPRRLCLPGDTTTIS